MFLLSALFVSSSADARVLEPRRWPDADPARIGISGLRSGSTHEAASERVGSVLIAAAGDIACKLPCPPQHATARLVELAGPRAVFALGDTQYQRGAFEEFKTSYEPSWGAFKGRTFPVPGDHEYQTTGANGYFRYFGARAHPPRGYYSFNLGAWHILALNAERGIRRQTRWIRRNLRRDRHRCELAFWHDPRWSSAIGGNHAEYDPWWSKLVNNGADVVLNGDQHHYERFARLGEDGSPSRRGVRELVVGTGGAPLFGFANVRDLGSQRRLKRHGILTMRLRPRRYNWRFIAVGGRVRDAGATDCHG